MLPDSTLQISMLGTYMVNRSIDRTGLPAYLAVVLVLLVDLPVLYRVHRQLVSNRAIFDFGRGFDFLDDLYLFV
jgi:hypothetical protein